MAALHELIMLVNQCRSQADESRSALDEAISKVMEARAAAFLALGDSESQSLKTTCNWLTTSLEQMIEAQGAIDLSKQHAERFINNLSA